MFNTDTTKVLTQTPSPALRPFVRRFLIVESAAAHQDAHLPDTGMVAAFRFQGDCQLEGSRQAPRAAITGLWDTVRTHMHSQDYGVVIVTFTATGAAALLRQPVHELANRTVALDSVLGARVGLDCLYDQIVMAENHSQRIRLVENFLLTQVSDSQVDRDIAAAVALIERTQTLVRVEELAQQIGLSQSALERRFRRRVGVSPRQFTSLVRLHHVLRLHTTGIDLTTLAHTAGYYDQSHFIKDFKRFTGFAPGSFFAHSAR